MKRFGLTTGMLPSADKRSCDSTSSTNFRHCLTAMWETLSVVKVLSGETESHLVWHHTKFMGNLQRDAGKVFQFVLMVDAGTVLQLGGQTGMIRFEHAHIHLVLVDERFRLQQAQVQSPRSVATSSICARNAIADVARAISQLCIQSMSEVEDADSVVVIIKEREFRGRHPPFMQHFSMRDILQSVTIAGDTLPMYVPGIIFETILILWKG